MSSQASAGNIITRFFAARAKRTALKRYLTILPGCLRQDYGHDGPLNPIQVERALRRHHVSDPSYWPYALALFCERASFDQFAADRGEAWDYERLRAEIGQSYFRKDAFSRRDVGHFYDRGDWVSGGDTGGGHGSGHHGGDGGGGHH